MLSIDLKTIMGFGRKVRIAGAGKTAFGAFPDKDLRMLSVAAGQKALTDAGLEAGAIQAFYLGNFAGPEFTGQNHLAPYVSTALGMKGIPATRVVPRGMNTSNPKRSKDASRRVEIVVATRS